MQAKQATTHLRYNAVSITRSVENTTEDFTVKIFVSSIKALKIRIQLQSLINPQFEERKNRLTIISILECRRHAQFGDESKDILRMHAFTLRMTLPLPSL